MAEGLSLLPKNPGVGSPLGWLKIKDVVKGLIPITLSPGVGSPF